MYVSVAIEVCKENSEFPIYVLYLYIPTGTCESSSSDEGEISDDPSTWKLSACTRQKARKRKPAEKNFVSSSNDNDNSESNDPLSSSCEEEREEEDGESESSVSESFEAGAAGFFDDEAMEASFGSELEEMEYEGSGESEVEGGEGEEEQGEVEGRRAFIMDEAEEEELLRAQKRRRRRRQLVSSSSSLSDAGQSDKENTESK